MSTQQEEQARKAALIAEHQVERVQPLAGGRYRREGDRVVKVEKEEAAPAPQPEHQE